MRCLLKKKMIISEPWDFQSVDGDNIIYVRPILYKNYGTIVKNLSSFNGATKYMLLVKRGRSNTYNIYRIDDDININEVSLESVSDFFLIGSM